MSEKKIELPIAQKKQAVDKYLFTLKRIARASLDRGKNNRSLAAISAACRIQYTINQTYSDEALEEMLLILSKRIVEIPAEYTSDVDTVLFYDGFGLDLRGWAASYARAFRATGYHLVYVAPLLSKGKIPHIEAEVKATGGELAFLETGEDYITWVRELNNIFVKYEPRTAFFYTTPYDVAAATVFDAYQGLVQRIQVDLTDHAFWIGTHAFDYVTECRIPGASNVVYERGVSETKILRIDPTPYIADDRLNETFPFDIEKEQYFFSGGALYKTLGDKEKRFYQIVEQILYNNPEIKFLYIGEGDCSEIERVRNSFPSRVYYIHERPDYYRLFENCLFFLNTYPMFGGLMMRCAALAGKVPLTLRHNSDHEGILFEQQSRGVEFDTVEEIVQEAGDLIRDAEYREKKCRDMEGACLSEIKFSENLRMMIEEGKTEFSFDTISRIDTKKFREEYLERLDVNSLALDTISLRMNKSLFLFYPGLFINKAVRRKKK